MNEGPRAGTRALDAELTAADGSLLSLLELLPGAEQTLLLLSGVNATANTYRLLAAVNKEIQSGFGDLLNIQLICYAPVEEKDVEWCDSVLFDTKAGVRRSYGKLASAYLIRADTYVSFRSPVSDGGVMLLTHLIRIFGDPLRKAPDQD